MKTSKLYSYFKENSFFVAISLLAVVARLLMISDMEWKYDEKLMFTMASEALHTVSLPWLGMESGAGIKNPGLSVWPFIFFRLLSDEPVMMATYVSILNIIAIAIFSYFSFAIVRNRVSGEEFKIWKYAILLALVSPLGILFSRKIWAQDLLPFFSILVVIFHYLRKSKRHSFLYGFFGALIGQVHMSGFIFSLALTLYTLFYEYMKKENTTKWLFWFLGSCIGSITLIPWFLYVIGQTHESTIGSTLNFNYSFYSNLYSYAWGIGLDYSLGNDFIQFLRAPVIGNRSTYLLGIIHYILVICSILSIGSFSNLIEKKQTSPSLFYIYAMIFCFGPILILLGIEAYHHYLIVTFPIIFLLLAQLLIHKAYLLRVFIICQLLISFSFIFFIHNRKSINGDYSTPYRHQMLKISD